MKNKIQTTLKIALILSICAVLYFFVVDLSFYLYISLLSMFCFKLGIPLIEKNKTNLIFWSDAAITITILFIILKQRY